MAAESVLVAVDFTADALRLALTQVDGTPLGDERWDLPPLNDDEAWAWEVGGRIATLFAREGNGRSALAVGIAAPGPVDPVTGRAGRAAVLPAGATLDRRRKPASCREHPSLAGMPRESQRSTRLGPCRCAAVRLICPFAGRNAARLELRGSPSGG